MREYNVSLRKRGAMMVLQNAQRYLELTYGLSEPHISEAHYLLMLSHKNVVRSTLVPTWARVKTEFASGKDLMPTLVERMQIAMRRFNNRRVLRKRGICPTHLTPMSWEGHPAGCKFEYVCFTCRDEQFHEIDEQNNHEEDTKRRIIELKYGI